MRTSYTTAILALTLSSALYGQTWNNGAEDQLWSSGQNWSSGAAPGTNATVQISTQPAGDAIVIDVGSLTLTSWTFNSSLTNSFDVVAAGAADSLTITGGITNNDEANHSFLLPVSAGGAATWNGPLAFRNIVNIDLAAITVVESVNFTGSVNLSITNASTYGRFLGAGVVDFTGAAVNFAGTYTGVAGDVFDFSTGTFTGATLNFASLPTLSNGLTWNTSQFVSQGILTVEVPEPSTMAALAGALVLGFAACRRRKVA